MKFKNYKIKINNESEFNEVVELAGKIGYRNEILYKNYKDSILLSDMGYTCDATTNISKYQEITIKQLRILADPESLIGRKVKGFKFEDEKYNGLRYLDKMNKLINKKGIIKNYYSEYNSFLINFTENFDYLYPLELIHGHLIEETIKQDNQTKIGEQNELKKVWVWDNDVDKAFETYLVGYFPKLKAKYLCITQDFIPDYDRNDFFRAETYKNISEKDPKKLDKIDIIKVFEKYGKDCLITTIEQLDKDYNLMQ